MSVSPTTNSCFATSALAYMSRLQACFTDVTLDSIETLALRLHQSWIEGRHVFICGNGGSAANALHMANDFHYGIGACGPGGNLPGLRVDALSANTSVITCLANDTGYENIYAHQLEVKGNEGDLLIVLSGSGNSPNVVRAIETANKIGIVTFAILGFSGGRCKELANTAIHFRTDDMQIAEDTQLVVGHICMQWLNSHKPSTIRSLD